MVTTVTVESLVTVTLRTSELVSLDIGSSSGVLVQSEHSTVEVLFFVSMAVKTSVVLAEDEMVCSDSGHVVVKIVWVPLMRVVTVVMSAVLVLLPVDGFVRDCEYSASSLDENELSL